MKSADGDEVVAGKNTVWLDAAVQQLQGALIALFNTWCDKVCAVVLQTCFSDGLFKTFATVKAGGTGVTEKAHQTLAALLQHVFGQIVGGGDVIEHDGIVIRIVVYASVNDDEWHMRTVGFARRAELLGGGENDAGNVFVVHQVQIHVLFVGVLVGVANDDRVATLVGGILYRTSDGGKKRVADIGDDQPDFGTGLRAQAACDQIGTIVQFGNGAQNQLAFLIGDVALIGDHARYGGGRYSGGFSDVFDAGHIRFLF